MALLKNGLIRGIYKGIITPGAKAGVAIGIGMLSAVPAVASAAGSLIRPVAKGAIKSGLMIFGTARSRPSPRRMGSARPAGERQGRPAPAHERASSFRDELKTEDELKRAASPAEYREGDMLPKPAPVSEREDRADPWIVRGY